MPMGLLSTTQKWKTLSEHVCAVSINGNVTFHEQQVCVYDFPSLSLATRASLDVSELVFKQEWRKWKSERNNQ